MRWLLIALLALNFGCAKKKKKTRPPPRVKVTQVMKKDIPLLLEGIGHVTAFNIADIKAQVEGRLMRVHYPQGHEVDEGDLLLTIDPRPFEAALAKSEAVLAENIANFEFAKDQVTRYGPLVDKNYVSQINYDEYVRNKKFYEATILANEADILTAKINLDYCYIKAPFKGRIGKKLIDEGNLIVNDGSTLLTMTQTKPIYIDFSLPEREISLLAEGQEITIEIPGQEKNPIKANLLVIDNVVNQGTGMINLRAVTPNEDEKLWPGQFVRSNLIAKTIKNALMVPHKAVNSGINGKFVYTVGADGVASKRAVALGEQLGEMIRVTKGLTDDDKVITVGQLNVLPGKKVQVVK